MAQNDKVHVILYSRPDCHLCHEAELTIRRTPCFRDIEIEIIDIDGDPGLQGRYGYDIPVVLIEGVEAFKHRVPADEFCHKVNAQRRE